MNRKGFWIFWAIVALCITGGRRRHIARNFARDFRALPRRAEARESAPRFRVQIYRRAPDYAGGRRRTDRYPAVDRPFRRLIAAEVAGGCLEPCTKKNPASAGFGFLPIAALTV